MAFIKVEATPQLRKHINTIFTDEFMRENRCAALSPGFNGYTESMKVLRHAIAHRDERMIYVFPTDQYPYAGVMSCDVPSFMNPMLLPSSGYLK